MTQMEKAFETAIKESAFQNFQKIFRKSLQDNAECTVAAEISKHDFPQVTSKNIQDLTPDKAVDELVRCIKNAIETLFTEACFQAKIEALKASEGFFGKKTLESMIDKDFSPFVNQIVSEQFSVYDAPRSVYITANKIFEAFFAQTYLTKLIKKASEKEDKAFLSIIDELSEKAVKETLLTMYDKMQKEAYLPFKENFARLLMQKLSYRYSGADKDAALNDVTKKVLSAFICRR